MFRQAKPASTVARVGAVVDKVSIGARLFTDPGLREVAQNPRETPLVVGWRRVIQSLSVHALSVWRVSLAPCNLGGYIVRTVYAVPRGSAGRRKTARSGWCPSWPRDTG